MKLNLGCGNKRVDGYIGVDKFRGDAVDVIWDLEKWPWPWEDNSIDAILMSHVLEHLGQSTDVYLGIIKELYRVCKHGAKISIRVPHPRHSDFLNDPTHVRAITPEALLLFSRAECLKWQKHGSANTPLALYLGVDFELKHSTMIVEPAWANHPDLETASRTYNDVVKQINIELTAIKCATE